MHTNVSTEVVIDYAYPAMMVETSMRNLHQAALHGDFEKAMEFALKAIADAKLTYNALREMKPK
jgi:hypothetical protein